jgi:hypothetical protein
VHPEPLLDVLEFEVCVLVLVEVPSMPAVLFSKIKQKSLNKVTYSNMHTERSLAEGTGIYYAIIK